jgi:hypothetical protein
LGDIDVSIGKINGSMEVLIPRLARASLSEAERNANESNAGETITALKDASDLISRATALQIPIQHVFFEDAINVLNRLATLPVSGNIEPQIYDARLALAQYHSSIEKVPVLPKQITQMNKTLTIMGDGPTDSRISWGGPPGINMFIIPPTQPPHLVSTNFENIAREDGWQKLDNAAWRNVIFVNMHLSYGGGNLVLEKVKFIKCIFDVPHLPNVTRLLDYAALNDQSLRLGFNFPPRMMIGRNGL